ncbi:MAG: hypothetical protein JXA33_01210 [Anaerolineae bacterium]|nr:hypothetical protein [Anaerolineae bacterium]
MNRIFSIAQGISVPDGTTVYPFLNSKDETSGLPWSLLDGFSLSAGVVAPKSSSKIHIMPLVTQVTFVLEGTIEIWMKGSENPEPYKQVLTSRQAILTNPGAFFQLVNSSMAVCWLLYIVSPAYVFELSDENEVIYDDSIILNENWKELEAKNWLSANPCDVEKMREDRAVASARLAAQSRARS